MGDVDVGRVERIGQDGQRYSSDDMADAGELRPRFLIDQFADQRRADHHHRRDGHEQQSYRLGRISHGPFEVERRQYADHGGGDEEQHHAGAGQAEPLHPEDGDVQQRLRRSLLPVDERHQRDDQHDEPEDGHQADRSGVRQLPHHQQQRGGGDYPGEGADHVELLHRRLRLREAHHLDGRQSSDDADRHVDEEDVLPAQRADDETTQRRADHAGDGYDAADQTHHLAAVLRQGYLEADRHGYGEQHRRSDALNDAEHDELAERGGQAA